MKTKINENLLAHIVRLIGNQKVLRVTHDWILAPDGEKKKYSELTFSDFNTETINEFNIVIDDKWAKFKMINSNNKTETYKYFRTKDKVVFGENYIDVIAYSYGKKEFNYSELVVVWRFFLD